MVLVVLVLVLLVGPQVSSNWKVEDKFLLGGQYSQYRRLERRQTTPSKKVGSLEVRFAFN
jgi:hypothetical protein